MIINRQQIKNGFNELYKLANSLDGCSEEEVPEILEKIDRLVYETKMLIIEDMTDDEIENMEY